MKYTNKERWWTFLKRTVLYESYQHCKALTTIKDTLNSKHYAKS